MTEKETIAQLRNEVDDLQTRLAFQEDTLRALDEVVIRQQRQIENLQELWQGQKSQLERLQTELENDVVDVKPPHY